MILILKLELIEIKSNFREWWVSLIPSPDLSRPDSLYSSIATTWCEDHFGEQGGSWYAHSSGWVFVNKDDAVLFMLTWDNSEVTW